MPELFHDLSLICSWIKPSNLVWVIFCCFFETIPTHTKPPCNQIGPSKDLILSEKVLLIIMQRTRRASRTTDASLEDEWPWTDLWSMLPSKISNFNMKYVCRMYCNRSFFPSVPRTAKIGHSFPCPHSFLRSTRNERNRGTSHPYIHRRWGESVWESNENNFYWLELIHDACWITMVESDDVMDESIRWG